MRSAIFLFFVLLASQAQASEAIVLICSKDGECTVTTARIVFTVPVESPLPAQCLESGMKKIAEVADLKSEDETVRVNCK